MKPLWCAVVAVIAINVSSVVGQTAATGIPVSSDSVGIGASAGGDGYIVLERGPNHKVVGHVTSEILPSGKVITYTNSYVELAGGMHYLDQTSGLWTESQELVESFPGGAVARHGPNQVVFANDLATPGAVDMLTPDGKRLTSHILGLAYIDSVTGASVLICETTNSLGSIVPPNQVVYPNAFDALRAYVQYTYRRSGLEQDIVLLEAPPLPEAFGMNSATARLVVLTEFINAPDAMVQSSVFADGAGQVSDETLKFGTVHIGPGKGFLLGAGQGGQGLRISKEWSLMEGRRFLIEQVSVTDLMRAITTLPKNQGSSIGTPSKAIRFSASSKEKLPGPKRSKASNKPMEMASYKPAEKGYILDYVTVVSSNNFTFQADTTYYVSGTLSMGGTVRCEGGSVIKMAPTNNAQLTISGSLVTLGTQYRPTIFTARDDNTVGELIPGGLANPNTNFYGTMLSLSSATTLNDCRFLYASNAISTTANLTLTNVQFIQCGTPIYAAANSLTFTVRNGLFWSNSIVFGQGQSEVFKGEHLTVNQPGTFFTASGSPSCTVYLTNCLLVGLSGWGNNVTASATNQVPWLSSGSGTFQSVGAGYAYLADNSGYRNAGTTNIDQGLAGNLKLRTTYPPLLITSNFTGDTVLSPQAPRDTDLPDLGYHYDPIDWAISGLSLTNTLLLTNGTSLAVYGTNGLNLKSGAKVVSRGEAAILNHLARYSSVQEQPILWGNTNATMSLMFVGSTYSLWPQVWLRFTDVPLLANSWGKRYLLNINGNVVSNLVCQDCRLCGPALYFNATSGSGVMRYAFTNNLILRAYMELVMDNGSEAATVQAYNNLLQGGTITWQEYAGSTNWNAFDNLFDRVSPSSSGVNNGTNGYVTNYSKLGGTKGGDVVLTNAPVYQSSYLGTFYYPTNDGMLSKLIDAGSRWATNAGLYHFTTTTNQVKEASTKVDIGFHFVAVNPSTGQPYDADGDGTPDYVEDANGNGVADGSETDWQSYNSPNGLIGAAGLEVFTPLK